MALTSFFADAGHEMVTAVLPGFLHALGVGAAALGYIEGSADAASSFVKLASGWRADRVGKRKGIVAAGYAVTSTALALLAAAVSWPLVLVGRVLSWMSRGVRSPLREAMLADAVPAEARGRAFGLHRAADTAGAALGPLAGVWLLAFLPHPNLAHPYRIIFLLSLIPGALAVASFMALVREPKRQPRPGLRLREALGELPAGYRRFLRGIGVFGMGDYSHTLLILAAVMLLTSHLGGLRAAQAAALLYVLHNLVYAGASYPVGVLADRGRRAQLLAAGYVCGALAAAGLALLTLHPAHLLPALIFIFAVAGLQMGVQDALEGAIPAALTPPTARGTAYGLRGTVNGIGDFVASALVGTLWTAVSPALAFGVAAAVMLAGAALIAVQPL